ARPGRTRRERRARPAGSPRPRRRRRARSGHHTRSTRSRRGAPRAHGPISNAPERGDVQAFGYCNAFQGTGGIATPRNSVFAARAASIVIPVLAEVPPTSRREYRFVALLAMQTTSASSSKHVLWKTGGVNVAVKVHVPPTFSQRS